MAKLLETGHAERVIPNSQQMKKEEEWYILHHPMGNAAKNTKVRIVFDRAVKYEGVALNEKVLQGPDLIDGLLGILLRFRQHPVALTANVEAMFLQVKVPPCRRPRRTSVPLVARRRHHCETCRSIVCRHTCSEGRGVRAYALTHYNRLLRTRLRTFTQRSETWYCKLTFR